MVIDLIDSPKDLPADVMARISANMFRKQRDLRSAAVDQSTTTRSDPFF